MSESSLSELSQAPSDLSERDTPATTTTATSGATLSVRSKTSKANRKAPNAKKSAAQKPKIKNEDPDAEPATTTPKNRKHRRTSNAAEEVKVEVEEDQAGTIVKKGKKKRKTKQDIADDDGEAVKKELEEDSSVKKPKKKRKTKEEKEAEAMPLAARSTGLKHFIGAHVSSAGGVHNSVNNSVHIGANAFALFLKSQRKWANPPLQDEHCDTFISNCKHHVYDSAQHVLPHGSYLVNLAHTDPERTTQAYDAFLDDLNRCRRLGIKLYNFHPGNAASSTHEEAITHLATQLNRAHKDPGSGDVVTLLETMATRGNCIGGTFEDLADTIRQVSDKSRVGVCLDTCHVFAAGYDLRTPEAFKKTIDHFDSVIGLKYLRALHVNDSKAPLSSNRDLHANIGTGFLGLRAFHNMMNDPRLAGLPMVLETPIDVKNPETGKEEQDKRIWATEIKMLESLVGIDPESDEFKKMEARLHERGVDERERVQGQVDRREEKKREKEEKEKTKKEGKGKGKGKKKTVKKEEEESDLSDVD